MSNSTITQMTLLNPLSTEPGEDQKTEAALKESEDRYRNVVDLSPDTIIVHSGWRVKYVNDAGVKLLGADSPADLLGNPMLELVHPDYVGVVRKRIQDLYDGKEAHLIEEKYLRLDGQAVDVEVAAKPISYRGSAATLVLARDITERKQMHSYMLRIERLAAMGRLAMALAHEINNPLQNISVMLELLLDFPLRAQKKQRYLRALNSEIARLMDLVKCTLDFARPQELERRPVSVSQILRQALLLAEEQLQCSNINLRLDVEDQTPLILASADQLQQVFLNLIINAIEAMPGGGMLHVSAHVSDDQILLNFTDSGSGIEPGAVAMIFEPFYSTKANGTGLGLSISSSIVQQHGGRLTAENLTEGGAAFTVALPLNLPRGQGEAA